MINCSYLKVAKSLAEKRGRKHNVQEQLFEIEQEQD